MRRPVPVAACAVALLCAAAPARAESPSHPLAPLRAGAGLLLGVGGGDFGMAADGFVAYDPAILRARRFTGGEFPWFCADHCETETTESLLAGYRAERPWGAWSVASGIARVDRDSRIERGYLEPRMHRYRGPGVPVSCDVLLSGRFIGLQVSATVMMDGDGSAGYVLAGMPIGCGIL